MKLTVENASFGYRKGQTILKEVDFTASSGDVVAILGANGTGKTTLLRCLIGSLKWNSGRACLDGQDIRTIHQREFWRRVGYVPQARGVVSGMIVEDMIMMGMTSRIGVFASPGEAERKKVCELAERLRISHLLERRCSEMSGGELQMVLIARALAGEPELIILDEPESNLDFRNQLLVLDTIMELANQGMCCIFNTHYPTHALGRAGKSLLMMKGERPLFGDTRAVLTEDNIERAFGVRSVLGRVETDGRTFESIIPVEIIG